MRGNKKMDIFLFQTIFIGPALIFFLLIVLVPFVITIYYSFTDWNGISSDISLVGFKKNYTGLLTDRSFIKSFFWFTASFTTAVVVIGNLLAFALALLLTSSIKLKNFYRTSIFLPNVISGFILGFVWQFIFVWVFPIIGEKKLALVSLTFHG